MSTAEFHVATFLDNDEVVGLICQTCVRTLGTWDGAVLLPEVNEAAAAHLLDFHADGAA